MYMHILFLYYKMIILQFLMYIYMQLFSNVDGLQLWYYIFVDKLVIFFNILLYSING